MSTGLLISRSTPVAAEVREGRVVEAYAAVFGTPAEIIDQQGHYTEVIDRSAFNKAIKDAAPQGRRAEWLTGVFYNHGLTIHGDSAPEFSVPLGRTLHVEADSTGVLTRTEYAQTRLADDILELIRQGAIRAQSFTGRIVRSSPELTAGGRYRPDGRGALPTVRRLELGLREYGPTPIPAYQAAEVVGVRSALLNALAGGNTAILRALLDATTDDDPLAAGDVAEAGDGQSSTPPDDGAAGDAPHEEGEHSDQSAGQEPLTPEPVHAARTTADEWTLAMRAKLRARGIV
jgi:HK97 family phage prohead protease